MVLRDKKNLWTILLQVLECKIIREIVFFNCTPVYNGILFITEYKNYSLRTVYWYLMTLANKNANENVTILQILTFNI